MAVQANSQDQEVLQHLDQVEFCHDAIENRKDVLLKTDIIYQLDKVFSAGTMQFLGSVFLEKKDGILISTTGKKEWANAYGVDMAKLDSFRVKCGKHQWTLHMFDLKTVKKVGTS